LKTSPDVLETSRRMRDGEGMSLHRLHARNSRVSPRTRACSSRSWRCGRRPDLAVIAAGSPRSAGTFWDVSAVGTPVRGVCPRCRWKFREGRTHCMGPSSGVASRLRCDGVAADSRVGAHGAMTSKRADRVRSKDQCLWRSEGRCERGSLAGTDAGETGHGWPEGDVPRVLLLDQTGSLPRRLRT